MIRYVCDNCGITADGPLLPADWSTCMVSVPVPPGSMETMHLCNLHDAKDLISGESTQAA